MFLQEREYKPTEVKLLTDYRRTRVTGDAVQQAAVTELQRPGSSSSSSFMGSNEERFKQRNTEGQRCRNY